MPQDRKKEFKNEFTHEFLKRRFACQKNNQEIFIDLYKILIVYAQKINNVA